MGHVPDHLTMARREAAWREAIAGAEVEAKHRLNLIARCLGCSPELRQKLVLAGLEVAREFAAVTSYASYEHRTGQLWPEEWRDLDDEERAHAWRLAIDDVVAAARGQANPLPSPAAGGAKPALAEMIHRRSLD